MLRKTEVSPCCKRNRKQKKEKEKSKSRKQQQQQQKQKKKQKNKSKKQKQIIPCPYIFMKDTIRHNIAQMTSTSKA